LKNRKDKFLHLFIAKLLTVGTVTFLLGLAAFRAGIGYGIKDFSYSYEEFVDIPQDYDYAERGHLSGPTLRMGGLPHTARVNVSFNAFLYPLSYLLKNGQSSSTYKEFEYPILLPGTYHRVIDYAISQAILPKFLRNFPYLLFLGLLIESVFRELVLQSSKENTQIETIKQTSK
jgi:hypothetical protein